MKQNSVNSSPSWFPALGGGCIYQQRTARGAKQAPCQLASDAEVETRWETRRPENNASHLRDLTRTVPTAAAAANLGQDPIEFAIVDATSGCSCRTRPAILVLAPGMDHLAGRTRDGEPSHTDTAPAPNIQRMPPPKVPGPSGLYPGGSLAFQDQDWVSPRHAECTAPRSANHCRASGDDTHTATRHARASAARESPRVHSHQGRGSIPPLPDEARKSYSWQSRVSAGRRPGITHHSTHDCPVLLPPPVSANEREPAPQPHELGHFISRSDALERPITICCCAGRAGHSKGPSIRDPHRGRQARFFEKNTRRKNTKNRRS